ncbi:AFP-like domain-containing protein [Vibrio chagasii]|nr:AFP-like domain-containing protein [Vibrio chagasii]CAH7155319.1 AFP-like domain-containing protein [Vibrio chagasii]CAH7211026.1 AFP-like domain-containing protein [Vibrio chagasii]
MRNFFIGDRVIGDNQPCYVIAEIGGNFKTYNEAKKLIDAAHEAGADAVKLQTFKAETLASKLAKYEMANTGNVSQYDLFKEYEIGKELHEKVYAYSKEKGLDIFSTPSHASDLQMLEDIGTNVYKIGSDDSNNLNFIAEVAALQKPLIVATGMCTLKEVDDIVDTISKTGNTNFSILHAITSYPTEYNIANLNVIKTYKNRYPGVVIGYSDHTIGMQCSLAARVMGADIIERHFTLDRNAEGPDHILSSDPDEMKFLIDSIRIVEEAFGNGVKMPVHQEQINRRNNRKSIVLNKNLEQGDTISKDAICVKRPGTGIEASQFNMIIGRKVNKALVKDEVLTWNDLGE